jgi:hypothetical protein
MTVAASQWSPLTNTKCLTETKYPVNVLAFNLMQAEVQVHIIILSHPLCTQQSCRYPVITRHTVQILPCITGHGV